jgi:hypothetical protein
MKIRGFFFALFTFSVFLFISWDATAELVKIGNATYEGQPYNLIYDEDQDLIWMDYTLSRANWLSQMNWAAGLNESGVLTYDIDPKYTVFWNEEDLWRLPSVDENVVYLPNIASDCDRAYCWGYWGPDEHGKYDYLYGYNIVNSEILHLYYKSFGNKGYRGTDGYPNQPGWGLLNTGPFINLYPVAYHSGTLASENIPFYFAGQPYVLGMDEGSQIIAGHKEGLHFAIAVRSAQVSAVPTDSDNDGVPDDSDNCPESDLRETVVIDGCDTGVENILLGDGCTMSDLIDELADNAENHGQFVSSVSHLTINWKKEQLITGSAKGAILSCAAKVKIPDCRFNEGVIILDILGIEFDQDGTVDLEYLSEDFLGNPGPFLATEGGSYCGGAGIGSGNRIAFGPGFGIADFCALETAINFVPGSDSIGTYATYTGGGPGEIFIVRAFDGTGYFKIQIIDEGPDKIDFWWAEVSPPDCETCIPGQDGMEVCFP